MARGGKICGRRVETALEPENGVCLIDYPGRNTQLEESEDFSIPLIPYLQMSLQCAL